MPLYSTDIHSKAWGNKHNADKKQTPAERNILPDAGSAAWCYLFVHHAKVGMINDLLGKQFRTFIHKTTIYKKENKRIRKQERQTISGLIFVQGDKDEIQDFLNSNCQGTYLATDCSTKTTAVIPDKVMRPFMQLDLKCGRIRFMPHPLDYYSEGHPLVRITSGLLEGFEGYRIRISRNKCLVTSIGGMTVAISGISNDSFENVDEYITLRRGQQMAGNVDSGCPNGLHGEIARCFFRPQCQLDVVAIARSLRQKMALSRVLWDKGDYAEAVDLQLILLENTVSWVNGVAGSMTPYNVKDVYAVCTDASGLLEQMLESECLPEDYRTKIRKARQSLAAKYPMLAAAMGKCP